MDPIPSFYQDPGLSKDRSYDSDHYSETIDSFTGKLQFHDIDILLPGNGGLDIKVQRSYSSLDGFLREPSPIGVGWTIGFGRILRRVTLGYSICDPTLGPLKNPVFEGPDGSRQILYASDDLTEFYSTSLWRATCASNANGDYLQLTSPDGTIYAMSVAGPQISAGSGSSSVTQQSWYPSTITDRNGNSLTFIYNNAPSADYMEVSTVTANDGRVVTFTYTNDVLTGVSDGVHTIRYGYVPVPNGQGVPNGANGYNYLTTVTRADNSTWSYGYIQTLDGITPGAGSIQSVKFPTGGSITYTYGNEQFSTALPISHVVTSKTESTGPQASWTYSYTPATAAIALDGNGGFTASCPDPTVDVTLVTAPDGQHESCHFGYNSVSPGIVYLIGYELVTYDGSIQTSSFSANPFQITTAQQLVRPGAAVADQTVNAPLVSQKLIVRDGATYSTTYSNYDNYMNAQTVAETGTNSKTTAVSYYVDPTKWILHIPQNETLTVDGVAGGSITRSFDGNANKLTESRYGTTTHWTYGNPQGSFGLVTSKTDANGNQVLYSSYKGGIPQNETWPLGISISRVVDNGGRVTSETDGTGATTGYTYDALDRITGITHPLGNPVAVTWTPTTKTLTRGGFQSVDYVDPYARPIKTVVSGSSTTITVNKTVDGLGRLIFQSDPNSAYGTSYTYDLLDRKTSVLYTCLGYQAGESGCLVGATPNGDGSAGESWAYTGNTTLYTDRDANAYTYGYRSFGEPDHRSMISITAPDPSANVAISRNPIDQPLMVTQGAGAGQFSRTYGYNSQYFLTSQVDPETGTTTFGRDTIGNMTSKQVGTSGVTQYVYDGLNRLTNINYPTGTPSVTNAYYADNRLQSATSSVATRGFVYDQNKNLTSETTKVGGQTFTTGYSYNGNDARSVLTFNSGKTVTYSPDGLSRPTQLAPYATTISWFPNGAVASVALANGLTTTYTQDPHLWPATQTVTGPSSKPAILNSNYQYDPAGNITNIADSVDPTQARTVSIDPLQRVTAVVGPWGNGSLTYDGIGNIQSYSGQEQLSYHYNPTTNLLSSVVGSKPYTLSYDAYGNVTNNGSLAFSYNDALNMTCSGCGGAQETDYGYDGMGMRVSKTPTGGTPTYFIYSQSGDLLSEFTPGTQTKDYVYLLGRQIATRSSDLTSGDASSTPTSGGSTMIKVSVSPNSTSIAAGTNVTYSMIVTNSGSEAAANVNLIDTLPANQSLVSAVIGSIPCVVSGATVSCSIGNESAGANVTVTIVAKGVTAGSGSNVATLQSSTANTAGTAATAVTTITVH